MVDLMTVNLAKVYLREYLSGRSVPAVSFHEANEVLAEHYGLDSLRWPTHRTRYAGRVFPA